MQITFLSPSQWGSSEAAHVRAEHSAAVLDTAVFAHGTEGQPLRERHLSCCDQVRAVSAYLRLQVVRYTSSRQRLSEQVHVMEVSQSMQTTVFVWQKFQMFVCPVCG